MLTDEWQGLYKPITTWPIRSWHADRVFWVSIVLAVPLDLPAGEQPALWADTAELAGFELAPAEGESWARLEPRDEVWLLTVQDPTGAVRSVEVPAPTGPADREDMVFLASSLLVPQKVEPPKLPAPPVHVPPPRPDPGPEIAAPAVVMAPPTEPAEPVIEWRLDAGLALFHGQSARPWVAPSFSVALGPARVGVELGLAPWSAAPAHDLTVHQLAASGFVSWSLEPMSVAVGLGPSFRAYRNDAVSVLGVVSVASLRVGWERGRLSPWMRLSGDVRAVDVQQGDEVDRQPRLAGAAGLSVSL